MIHAPKLTKSSNTIVLEILALDRNALIFGWQDADKGFLVLDLPRILFARNLSQKSDKWNALSAIASITDGLLPSPGAARSLRQESPGMQQER